MYGAVYHMWSKQEFRLDTREGLIMALVEAAGDGAGTLNRVGIRIGFRYGTTLELPARPAR